MHSSLKEKAERSAFFIACLKFLTKFENFAKHFEIILINKKSLIK